MKKIILSILLSFSALTCFALDKKSDALGFGFSTPFIMESANSNGIKTFGTMSSIAFGMHGTTLYTDKLGIYSSCDLLLPLTLTSTITNGSETVTLNTKRSDYTSLWGLTAMLGPAICISKTEKNLFIISPGIHYYMLFADANRNSTASYVFGVGANFQFTLLFGSNGFFNVGGDVAFDFFGFSRLGSYSGSTKSVMFSIAPKVGVGFRFQ